MKYLYSYSTVLWEVQYSHASTAAGIQGLAHTFTSWKFATWRLVCRGLTALCLGIYMYTYIYICVRYIYRDTHTIFLTLLRCFLCEKRMKKAHPVLKRQNNYQAQLLIYCRIASGFQRIRGNTGTMIPDVLKLHHGSIMSEICRLNGWAGICHGACPPF